MIFEYLDNGNPEVCELVLRSLPDWFGIEESTVAYIQKSKTMPMIVANREDGPVGFVSLLRHSDFTYEVYVMGGLPKYHGQGIGKQLLAKAEDKVASWDADYLQVKTVSADRECEFYKKTRLFYKSFGFKEIEVFPKLWDEHNPCQLLIKNIYRNENNVDRVLITPYQEDWPKQFCIIRDLLKEAIGEYALSIDHIGSTSVPGLAAKDRIDVQITVKEITDEFKLKFDESLNNYGFLKSKNYSDHRPPGDNSPEEHWKKLYITGIHPKIDFKTNIHVRVLGRENQKYPILFRDYLRLHPDAMKAYEMLKKELSRFHSFDRIAYCEIKDPVCDLIMVNARSWAIQTNWQLEESFSSQT